MRISIVLGTMIRGGAHRVACMQANELIERGFDVTLLLVIGSTSFPYKINEKVKVKYVMRPESLEFSTIKSKVKRKILAIPLMVRVLKNIQPDLIISHCQGTNREAIISAKFLKIPIIACEHTTYLLPYGKFARLFAYIERHFLYKLANKVTLLTSFDKENFYDNHLANAIVMPNPCPFEPSLRVLQRNRGKSILAVGDLNRVFIKGWDNLIFIFSRVSKQFPEWTLQFAGNGDVGKAYLQQLAKEHGVADKVKFLGTFSDVSTVMQDSSVFILTSRNEGFSMALAEAMSQGCACIAYDCKSGPADIITNNIDGFLVRDQSTDEMCKQLCVLLSDEEQRVSFSEQAVISSKRFSQNVIFDKWEDIINDIITK